ncbi:MAG: hypothetical protein A2X52_12005 [Candidatus Rokubacteria bacterium GWC2_70_16]|nr:MAG: hypothetical protein A2X52_12005 [Candidatus Rokubacteria bacterium GWC2_70_16]
MEEFLRSYGVWILLLGVFVAMHRFGMGCGGGHSRQRDAEEEPGKPTEEKKRPAESGRSGGCH